MTRAGCGLTAAASAWRPMHAGRPAGIVVAMNGDRPRRRPNRREQLVFGACAALLATQAVIEAFVAPDAGTGWDDHLASGLVPIALLLVSAVAYPRLPPGGRAVLVGILGLLALEQGVLGLVAVLRSTAAASDRLALLLVGAGLALVGLAVALLWRSRRASGRRVLRRSLLVIAAVVGAYVLVLPVGVAVLATHRPRADVARPDLGRSYESVTITTADGLNLAGWYIPSRNGAAIVSFPTRAGKPEHARMLARHGFGVLLLDMRGYDGSEGSPNAYGWGATRDIDAAVAWLRRRPDVRDGQIGGIGFSVGGEQMLEAATGNTSLRAVVAEGAGERSLREALIYGPRGWLRIPTMAVQTAAVAVLSDSAPPPALDRVTAGIAPRPILLIYAGDGTGGEELNPDYFRSAREPKELWKIPEASHTRGLEARPAEYERRVVGLFEDALLGGRD